MDCLLTRRENLSAVRSPAYVDASGRAVILMRRQIEPRAFSIKPSPPRADTLGDGRIRNRVVSRDRSPRTVLDAPAARPPSDRHEPQRWLAVLAVWAGTCGLAHGQTPAGPPPDPPQSSALEERLRRVEEVNARLLEQLNRDREESSPTRTAQLGGSLP